jgi:hypothetical protein
MWPEMKLFQVLPVMLIGLSSNMTRAHHSFAASYDPARLVTVEGIVTGLQLVNPHAIIQVNVTNDSGEVEAWLIEMPGKLSLARRGWTDETVIPGETVTAVGNPSLTGKNAMWWQRVTLADGTELLFPALADQLAIEEQRAERVLSTDQ